MPQRIRRASKEQLAPAIESFEYRVMLSAQTFSVSGPASVTEDPTDGDNNLATYTISYTGALGTGESASVDVSHVLNQTNSADYTSTAYDAIATAVAGTSGTSFDSNTGRLTFNNTSGTTTGTTSGYPTVATDAADGDYGWDNLAFATGNNSSNAASQTGVHHYDVANTIRLKGFGLNVPTNATITGIQVVLTTTGSSNSAGAVKLTKNGTSAVGTPPAASGTWSSGLVTHGGSTSMWGTTWTPADLNSSNFGLLIQPDPSGGSSNNFYIYNAYVEVTYTTSTNVSPTSLTFSLPIANDSEHEGTENFSLTISNPLSTSAGGADIATATASTDIGDDDVTFTISGASTVTETTSDGDNNQATYTVTYSGTLPAGSTASVTVNRDWNQTSSGDFTNSLKSAIEAAIAAGAPGVSYNRSTGVLTFSGGSGNTHSLTFTLDLADDAVVENSEQYSISLSNPSATSPHSAVLGTSSVTTTVTSDDVAAPQVVSIAGPATVGENPADPNGNSAEYTINYNGTLGLGDSVSVDVTHLFGDTDGADFSSTVANALATAAASTPGVSYNAGTGTLTFSNGTANVLRTLVGYPTTATQASDGDEAWTNLFDAIGNTPSTATDVNITHNYYTSNTLRLTGYELDIPTNATINGIKVALTTTGSTATSAASVLLTKNGTTAVGSGASSTGSWSSGSVVYGGSTSQWGTTWTPAELNSGNFGVLISIDDDGHFYLYNAQIEVSYTTVDSVSPTSVTFSVPITNDASLEGDEDFSISLGNVSATGSEGAGLGTSSVTTTIADDDIVFSISGNAQVTEITTDGDNNLATYTVGFEGVLASGKSASVKLTHNLGETVSADFVNTLNSAIAAAITAGATGVSYNSSTQVLTFSGGAGNATSLTFSLEIENDSLIEADETFSVSLSEATASSPYSASLGTSSANTTISNDDLFIFAVTGGGSVTEDSSDGDGNQVTYMVNYTGDLSSGQSVSVEVHHDLGDTAVGDYASTFASAIATAVGNTPGTSYDSLTHKLTFSHTVATVSESSVGYPSTASEASNGDASWANLANVTGDTPSTAATVDNGNHDIANTLRLTGYGLDVPSDATVTGIKLILTTTGSSTPDIVTVLLTKNGTTSVGSAASSTGSWASGSVSYGSMTSMWGTTWTPAELNSGNFGALISLEEEGSFAIYNARIEVSYTRVANITPTSLTFTLPVLDDIAAEATEEFAVTLSNPTVVGQIGAAIGTDSAGASIIDDDNTPSTDVILLNNSIDENSPIGTQFGLLTTEDADVGNTFVYTLVSGTGDDDNGLFSIVGDQIQLNTSLDFETKSEYSIRVRSTDQQAGYSIERTITIQVANVNPSVFYVKDDGVHGSELWKSDGSATGSVMVADVNPGSESSNPENIFVIGDTVYFTANDGVHGRELWKSDGTETGTVMVADINPGSGSSDAGQFTNWNDILYFVAGDGGNGLELWKSDGTQTGTTLVADINSGTAGSNPQRLTVSGSWLYMVANDGTHGRELWKSDGTSGGTSLVADLTSGTADSNPQELADVNGTLFFTHEDTTYGRELWKSDAGGTSLVLDARPGSASSTPLELTNVGGTLFMSLDDGVHGRELWKSDGTAGGTQLVSDVRPGSGSSLPEEFIDVNGEVYFTAFNDTTGAEIWKSGGTAATTSVVTDVSEVAYTGGPQRLRLVDEAVYFQLQTGSAAITLWRTDGTVSGTEMVTDTPANPDGSDSDSLLSVNGTLYFAPAESPLPAQSSQALNHAPVIIAMAQPPVWATFDRKAAGNEDGFEMLLKEFLELERIPYSQGAPTDFVTDLYDNSPQEGIAVFFATSTGGVWEYAIASTPPTDPNSWTPINGHNNATPVTQSSALLLKSDDQTWIRFNPSKKPNGATSTFTGDASLWFNAWDLTDGRSPGDRVSTLPTEKGVNKSISAQHTESIMYVTDSNAATPYIAPPIPTNLALTSITKNNYNSTGTAIYELLNPLNSVLPQDTYDKFGIAVTNVNTEFGTWQYTLNNGWIWSDLGPVSPTSAVLLMRNSRTRLRFIPNTDYAGEIENALTFKIWNPFVAIPGDENNPGTDFTAMNGFREINTTIAYGGKTPFSVDSVNAKITVTSDSNVPPVLNPNVSAPSWGLVLPNAVSEDFSIKFFLENQVDAQGNPLLAPLISDADTTDENLGVAVYSPVPIDDTAGGHWEYSTDNKNFWRVLNYESIIAARLLRATDTYFIRYRPSNEFSGTAPIPTLQVKAWDQTQGIIAGVGDVQSWTGDHAPFSLTTLASSFTYNIAPVIAVDSATTLDQINENQTDNPGTLVSDLISAARLGANAITDDLGLGGNELGIAITTADSTNGTWQFTTDGTTWDGLGNVSDVTARLLAADSTTRVRFVPNAGYHGDIPTGLTFRAWDQMRAGARFNGKNGDLADTSDTVLISGATFRNNGGATPFSEVKATASIKVNANPTDIALSNDTIAENSAVGTVIGFFSVMDSDGDAPYTYSLVTGTGDTDNALFTIEFDNSIGQSGEFVLKNAAIFNYESLSSPHTYSIRVRSTDAGGAFFEETFTISVLDIPEPPTFTGSATLPVISSSISSVDNVGLPVSDLLGQINASDPESSPLFLTGFVDGSSSGTWQKKAPTDTDWSTWELTDLVSSDSSIRFVPLDANSTGTASATFRLQNSNGEQSATDVAVSVDVTTITFGITGPDALTENPNDEPGIFEIHYLGPTLEAGQSASIKVTSNSPEVMSAISTRNLPGVTFDDLTSILKFQPLTSDVSQVPLTHQPNSISLESIPPQTVYTEWTFSANTTLPATVTRGTGFSLSIRPLRFSAFNLDLPADAIVDGIQVRLTTAASPSVVSLK